VRDPVLATEDLYKRFGGVVATDAVSLTIAAGEVHALIGPNGAGKTTLIGQMTGEIAPDRGRVRFRGRDVTAMPVHQRARFGLARSFQVTSIIGDATVEDNAALAVQAHAGHSFRFWRPAAKDAALRQPALAALARVGLAGRAQDRARDLSHGEQRQLEIAMVLAGEPVLLVLDEPTAGMGPDESARMVEILRGLKGTLSILLVEHDMDTVFALADRISVLVNGGVIASGDPAAIRANAAVRAAYLGAC
jgi:branched-chain amino acid transport system ATP-binding protein